MQSITKSKGPKFGVIPLFLVVGFIALLAFAFPHPSPPLGLQLFLGASISLSALIISNRSSYIFSARTYDLNAAQNIIFLRQMPQSAETYQEIAKNYLGTAQEFRYNALFLTHSAVYFIYATLFLLIAILAPSEWAFIPTILAVFLWGAATLSQVKRYSLYEYHRSLPQGGSVRIWSFYSRYTSKSQWLSRSGALLTFVWLTEPIAPSSEVMKLISNDRKLLTLWLELGHTVLLDKLGIRVWMMEN